MDKRQKIWESLKNKKYREAFSSDVGTGLAFQVRLIREHLGWNQEQLGKKTGKAQPTIAQLENPDYGRFSLDSLKRLANAFDVALMVRFVPFSELVDWTVGLTPECLTPPSFGEEEHYYVAASALAVATTVGDIKDTKDTDAYDLTLLNNRQLVINQQLASNKPILSIASTAQTEKELQYA